MITIDKKLFQNNFASYRDNIQLLDYKLSENIKTTFENLLTTVYTYFENEKMISGTFWNNYFAV